jgi:hypothetical protein
MKASLSAIATYAWAEIQAYEEAIGSKANPVGDDTVVLQDSEASLDIKRATLTNIMALQDNKWTEVDSSKYTDMPDSTTRILMSDTTSMEVGLPIKYIYGGTTYYGMIDAVTANTHIDIKGAALNTGVGVDTLYYGHSGLVIQKRIIIPGAYMVPWVDPDGDTEKTTMLADIAKEYWKWDGPEACFVALEGTQSTADTTAQPYFNVRVYQAAAWYPLVTDNANKGIQLSGTPGTWADSSAVGIDTDRYAIDEEDDLEVICDATGCDGDADHVTLQAIFVCK